MILYEFEGKALLKRAGINIPKSQLIESSDQQVELEYPVVLKAQVLSGKRADSGGIIVLDDPNELIASLSILFNKTINGEKVEKILVEEKVSFYEEYYLSLSYDTDSRGPILSISTKGGTGIENRKVDKYSLNVLNPTTNLPKTIPSDLLKRAIKLFFDQDCLLLEINPLVKGNEWRALDAKIKLDDTAKARHQDWNYPSRSVPGHPPSKQEIKAKKIDEGDYRGTAGSTYFDLEGDIAVLSSGGGVSLTALDALIASGGRPANFTEYSGNPPREKVARLTEIVLNKPNIHGLWVIGTVVANFTDIYETLLGFIEGLRQAQHKLRRRFDFPIVIRRGGPRDQEAFEMLKGVNDFNLILQGVETSIDQSARIMAEEAEKYAHTA